MSKRRRIDVDKVIKLGVQGYKTYQQYKHLLPKLSMPPIPWKSSFVSKHPPSVRSIAASGGLQKLTPCRPKVKVSKKFKAKVHAVASAKTVKGTYTLAKQGRLMTSQDANKQWADDGLYGGNGAVPVKLHTTSGANPEITYFFEFFTPRKALDAASVLFNSKTSDVHWDQATGNFEAKNLILEIPHMSVEMIFKNQGSQVYEVDFYQCVSKTSTDTSALAMWGQTLTALAGKENMASNDVTHWDMTPGMTPAWAGRWKYTRKRFRLEAGQDYKMYLKSGTQCYDYSKMLVGGTQPYYPKGKGLSCFYVVRKPNLTMIEPGNAQANNTQHRGDNFTRVLDTTNAAWALTCEIIEKYVIEAPELCDDAQKFDKFLHNCYQTQGGATAPYTQAEMSIDQTFQAREINELNPAVGITLNG